MRSKKFENHRAGVAVVFKQLPQWCGSGGVFCSRGIHKANTPLLWKRGGATTGPPTPGRRHYPPLGPPPPISIPCLLPILYRRGGRGEFKALPFGRPEKNVGLVCQRNYPGSCRRLLLIKLVVLNGVLLSFNSARCPLCSFPPYLGSR